MRFLEVKGIFQRQLYQRDLYPFDQLMPCLTAQTPKFHWAFFTIRYHITTLLDSLSLITGTPYDQRFKPFSPLAHSTAHCHRIRVAEVVTELWGTLFSPCSSRATQSPGLCPDSLWVPPRRKSSQPLWETFSMFNFLPSLPVINVAHFIFFQCHLLRIQYEFS